MDTEGADNTIGGHLIVKKAGILAALVAVGMVAALAWGVPVGAQIPLPLPSLSPEPEPSPSPSPSPTASQQPEPGGGGTGGGGGGGEQPAPQPPAPQPAAGPAQPAGPAAQGGPVLTVPDIVRTPAQNTLKLVDILTPVSDRGVPVEQALVLASAPFPVAGAAYYSHDFGFPRYVPFPHLHEGTDIFAPLGTPIVASVPGYVAGLGSNPVGGLSVWLGGDDGSGFYYTHMVAIAEGLAPGQRVDVGTVIGYVGNSGNAAGTPPHVHFEIHPPIKDKKGQIVAGGATTLPDGTGHTNTPAADPKPYLDAWLQQAEQRVSAFVLQFVERYAGIARELHFSRRVDELFPSDSVDRPELMIWQAVAQPALGTIALARQGVLDAGVGRAPANFAVRSAEEQRLAAVRLAVNARRIRLASITGRFGGTGSMIPRPAT